MSYQPQWRDGRTVGASRRDAEGRYRAIAERLSGRSGFTALDLGAHQGYFSHRLADEFGADVTAADDCPALQPHDGVTVIRKRLSAAEIMKLGHFDVSLCLSVLHHVPRWRDTVDALLAVSDALFVETAVPEESLPTAVAHSASAAITSYVESLGGRILTYTPGYDPEFSRPLWVIE